jgi:Transposase
VETDPTQKMFLCSRQTWTKPGGCGTQSRAWWSAIEVLITYRVTNARSEATNTRINRTGRGCRNPAHYQARILITSAARRAA